MNSERQFWTNMRKHHNGRAKLTREKVQAIRSDSRGKRTIAKEYGVSPAQVQRVRSGQQWK